MRYSIVVRLRGALAAAVSVEWTDHAAPEGSGAGWEPCLKSPGGDWLLYSYGAAAGRVRHLHAPGRVENIGLRYRLSPAGPWSEASADRKDVVILALEGDPVPAPPALRAADWSVQPPGEGAAVGEIALAGAAAAAVAVEWTRRDEGRPEIWAPCAVLGDGRWRPIVEDAAALEDAPVALRWRLAPEGPWSAASEDAKVLVPRVEPPWRPTLPVALVGPSLSGEGKIGAALVVAPGLWGGDPAPGLAFGWRRDGQEIAGATDASYVPGPADDLCDLTCVVTGANAAGAVVAETAPVRVTYVAPSARGALFEEIFDVGSGLQTVAAAGDFTGENLRFAVTGAGATIDLETGVASIPTDRPIAGETVTITASNSGGAASSAFLVTVEDAVLEEETPFALAADDVEVVRTVWRPAGQSTWFTPVLRFPGLAAEAVDAIEWTSSADPVSDGQCEIVRATAVAGEYELAMRDAARNVPGATPRTDFSVWRAGENRPLRLRWRRSPEGAWSDLSLAQAVTAPAQPDPDAPDPTEPPWRAFIRRPGVALTEPVDMPGYFSGGRYGGEGYQLMQTTAWAADGSACYSGQDMGLVRKSVSVAGRPVGEVFFTPPNIGLRGLGCMALNVDAADADVVVAATSTLSYFPGSLADLDGIYRTIDGATNWTQRYSIPGMAYPRNFNFNFAQWPVSGGSASTRRYIFTYAMEGGGAGGTLRSVDGGQSWAKIGSFTDAFIGRGIFMVVQHPTVKNTLYMATGAGIKRSTNEGASWAAPGWPARFNGDCPSIWIDPDDADHMMVGVLSTSSADWGIWETTNGGTGWTRIFSEFPVTGFGVSAPNGSGDRRIITHPYNTKEAPNTYRQSRVRRFNGQWVNLGWFIYDAASPQYNRIAQAQARQTHTQFHPTNPDQCVIQGLSGLLYAVAGEDAEYLRPCTNHYGSVYHAIGMNLSNPDQFLLAVTDQICIETTDGFLTARQNRIGDTNSDLVTASSKKGRACAWLPDPWPSGVPAPANSNVVGRKLVTFGPQSYILSQNKGSSVWTNFASLPEANGGGAAERSWMDYDPANPNFVYCGRNRSTDGGTTWLSVQNGWPLWAMSKVNGATVWAQSNDNTVLHRSTNRGVSFTQIFTFGYSNQDTRTNGAVWTLPGTDDALVVIAPGGDVGILIVSEARVYPLGIQDLYPAGTPARHKYFKNAAVSTYAPRTLMACFDSSGGPQVWLIKLAANYKSALEVTDATYNLPRTARSSGIFEHSESGNFLYTSGNGNFVYPAPPDWAHANPAKQSQKNSLFNKCARAVDNGWRA